LEREAGLRRFDGGEKVAEGTLRAGPEQADALVHRREIARARLDQRPDARETRRRRLEVGFLEGEQRTRSCTLLLGP
jgi:hypothetical protein